MADDIGSRGEDPRDVARRRLNIGRRLREGQVRTAQGQASGPSMTPSTRSMVPYRESLPAGGGRGGGGEGGGGGGRSMAPSGGERLPAPRPSSGELMRQGAGMGGGAPRAGGPRVVGGAGPTAAAGVALGLGSEALRRYMDNRGQRPIRGDFEQGMEPEGTPEAAAAETERQRVMAPTPAPAPRPRQAARPAPREMTADDLNEIVLRLNRGEKPVTETEKRIADRMGIAYRKGGMVKGKGMHMMPDGSMMKNKDHAAMKKGNKAMMYREGGKVRQGMQSPKAQEARAEMAEDVMRRERARDPISDKERKAGRVDAAMDSGPLTDAEKERMRASGFKKGGMIKPKTAMKKGGVVKKAAGGKVAAPKKMMKGGMTSKPKKMMGGGRAMYAKGGMARGCK